MNRTVLKYLSFGTLVLITIILMVATVIEKLYGSNFVMAHLYTSGWMMTLWGVSAFFSFSYMITRKLHRQLITLSLHLSFLVILGGALTTHFCAKQGQIHLRISSEAMNKFNLEDGTTTLFPFHVALKNFELKYYDGTFAPMDYVSYLSIEDNGETIEGQVSMNHIFTHRNYRFYQSGYDKDRQGTILKVSYDPYGIGITYIGYICLLLSMIGFFFQKGTAFRTLLKHPALQKGTMILLLLFLTIPEMHAQPKVLPREIAEKFCDLHLYYNDRICPLQTLAKDFTVKLYGKDSYKGLSAEQVLTGWFFFYDDWKREPIIKLKGKTIQTILGTETNYASLMDFTDINGYKLDKYMQQSKPNIKKQVEAANEKFNLVSMLCVGSLLKIYPCKEEGERVIWYSLADKLPSSIPHEKWLFIRESMNLIAERVAMKDYGRIVELLNKIKKYQMKEATDCIPSETRFKVEKIYNQTNLNRPLAMLCLTIGILSFVLCCVSSKEWEWVPQGLTILLYAILFYLTTHIVMRGYISHHIPLSNGFETMQFMAWCSVVITLIFRRKYRMALSFGYLLCGATMLVAMMGEATPQITQLMPVLHSPLLSIHVVVIMIAYSLLAFAMLNGITAIVLHCTHKPKAEEEIKHLQVLSQLMLYPAIFLLAIGIFVGAVWANVSWGRYWGWDPKEVWALITLLVYSTALHTSSLKWFCKPLHFHIFCILAFLTVLITYFGVNFLLGGMHSYA